MRFRLQCFFAHLIISLIIAGLSSLLIFYIWYPHPLAAALGAGGLTLLLIKIDVIIGPLLTFVVAKKGKKELKWDFAIIAILQVSALLYGLYSIEKGRPVWVAYGQGSFDLVQKGSVTRPADVEILLAYRSDTWLSPKWVAITPYKNNAEREERLFLELQTGVSPAMRPALYRPLEQSIALMKDAALPLEDLNKFNDSQAVTKVLAKYPEADAYLPMRSQILSMSVLINKNSASDIVVATVNLRPW